MAGRPTKLTPEIQEIIVKILKIGGYGKLACDTAGIDYTTLLRWCEQGEKDGEGKYYEFYKAVQGAKASFEERLLKKANMIVVNENFTDIRGILEFLGRTNPKQWAKLDKHEIGGYDGEPIPVDINDWKIKLKEKLNDNSD